jgi:hypothetical protein
MLVTRESSEKFGNDLVTELLWERTMISGQDDETGESAAPCGWNALFLFAADDEMRVYTMSKAVVLYVDSNGSVGYTGYDNQVMAREDFADLASTYAEWSEDD